MTPIEELPERFEKHLRVTEQSVTVLELLAANTSFSKQKLKQILKKGAVWLTHGRNTRRIRRASRTVSPGEILHLYYDQHILDQNNFSARLICDEIDYSVWFKPSGMLSQGSKYGDHSTIYRWAEMHIKPQRNAFPVHRLDRATSGLIIIAHSKRAAVALSQLFSDRKINKYYKALVRGRPEVPQTIEFPVDGKPAITRLLNVQKDTNECYSLLDIQILTGRKHQIRQHLAEIGHPIVGDRLYGNKDSDDNNTCDLGLTAYKMTFVSPFDQRQKQYELGSEYYPSIPEGSNK